MSMMRVAIACSLVANAGTILRSNRDTTDLRNMVIPFDRLGIRQVAQGLCVPAFAGTTGNFGS
jgi:hypothetical protein